MRKIKDVFLAIRIEQLLTKDEILVLYLNKIYLGYRAYGVGAAAHVYFGKTVDHLTRNERAVIAGLPTAPSTTRHKGQVPLPSSWRETSSSVQNAR